MKGSLKWVVAAAALLALVPVMSGTAAGRQAAKTAAAQTFTINVDGFNQRANESFLAYFPRAITVHAGDTVVFHYAGVGEPHTVTLGTLADTAVDMLNHA